MKVKFIYILSSLVIVALVSVCVFQIIQLTEEVYLVQKNQKILDGTFHQNELLSSNSLNSFSLREVEEIARDMGFVETRDVSYLEVHGSEVVVRQ